ncbi:MAG: helix-turn-helix domain-containing protein [Campylobacterales bacterium]
MALLSIPEIASKEEIEEFHRQIGQNVKQARLAKGVSQLELSLVIGQKSAAFMSRAENGSAKTHFNLEQLYKIAKALGVEIQGLLPS